MASLDDPHTLLAAWERAAGAVPAGRGAALLPVPDDEPLAAAAARAAAAYVTAYGPRALVLADCDVCGETLELAVDVARLAAVPTANPEAVVPTHDDVLTVRPLTTADLLAARAAVDPVGVLLSRCVRDSHGDAVTAETLTDAELGAVDDAAQHLAGVAAATLSTTCPGCGVAVGAAVDLVELLWEQVLVHATALVHEVATLAGAFGWAETDILALSATRRAAYLELVR